MASVKIKKHIAFPKPLIQLAERRADTMGFNFAEYLRYLVARDTEIYRTEPKTKQYPMVTEQEEREIGQALKNFKQGNYIVVKDKEDLDKIFE